MNRIITSISLLLYFLLTPAVSTAHDFMFKHIEVKDGLSNNQINHIFRDSQGFMWFSTAAGLNRYNGIKIDTYRNYGPDNLEVTDNYILDVQEDNDCNLWVHTPSGYVMFNPDIESFNIDIRSWMWEIGIDGVPSRMYIDKEKSFWFYIYGKGVFYYDPQTTHLKHILFADGVLPAGEIECITESNNLIFVIYNNGLLACVDKLSCSVKYIDDKIHTQIGSGKNDYFAAFVDMDQDLWIYGPFGLWLYSPENEQWVKHFCKTDINASYDMVRAVACDNNGRIWIGKDQSGIDILNKRTGEITKIECNTDDERALHHNTINAIYSDKDGGMWVGAYKRGVSCYYECSFKFGLDYLGDINCIEEGQDKSLWLGTNDAGLLRWNSRTNEKQYFTVKNTKGLNSDVIVSLLLSKNGKLWIGTFWGGLSCYDNGRFINFINKSDNKNSLSNNNVWALAEDKDENIWIGTLTGGLQCYSQSNGNFQTYTASADNLLSDIITSLYITRSNMMYIGTARGLSVMDLTNRNITNLTGTKSGKKSFTNLNINQVYEDTRGLIWIATREGVNIYNPKTDDLDIISVENGLSSQFVTGIVEDDSKNMWITTAKGVTNVITTIDDKSGLFIYRCYSYDDKDGLQNCEYNQRSIRKSSTGEILMGGLYGLNRHQPSQIKYNNVLPNVIFTDLLLFNEKIEISKEYNGRVILEKSVNRIESVKLEYEQNIFSVMFSSDNYVLPDKVKYMYKLEGFNDDWLTTNIGKVTYTNLTPGTYILKVKAINSDGYIGDKESCLKIIVNPPFWLTGWAFFLYLIILMIVLFAARYLVIKVERNRYKMDQIEQSAKKNQELNDMKLRFFTNISHDLRTPLTLIISPIDALIKEYKSDDILTDKLQMVQNNALRLLNMVNQLLDFRKSDVKGHTLSLSDGDIVEYIDNICTSFKSLSEKKNVHLTFFSSKQDLNISFDGDKIGKVLMNLLSNAFKFTSPGGRVDVSLDVINDGDKDTLEIKVSDNGIGIKDADKEHIFERFYQVNHPEHTGSGVGLNIVKDFVELHGGEVLILDNVPAGSVFIVRIPVRYPEQNIKTNINDEIIGFARTSAEALNYDTAKVADAAINAENIIIDKKKVSDTKEDKRPLLLIVDDNEDFLTFLYDSLSQMYQIKLTVNGREAWESVSESIPDLIISDVMMPVMDGNQLCRLVKSGKNTAHVPFIMLTAKDSTESRLEGFSLGADEYLSKPFNMDILQLRIKKLLELRPRKMGAQIVPEPSHIEITSLDEKLIDNAVKYIELNIANTDLSVEKLSHELGMSRVHLYKRLLAITGKTPIEFIRIIRLKRAAQLLRESQQNIAEISFQVGFNNPKYFSKYFKEEFGVLPSTYQETEGK